MMNTAFTLTALTSLWSAAWMTPAPTPAPERAARPPVSVRQIAVGNQHSCAVLSDDTVWCWGGNPFGELGIGSREMQRFPTAVPLLAKSVSPGNFYSCAIDLDDHLWCWGQNNHGQLGITRISDHESSPQEVMDVGKVKTVSAGHDFTCAIDVGNKLWCWGKELGTNDLNRPQLILPDTAFRSVSVGFFHACAIDLQNQLWCWGESREGRAERSPTIVLNSVKSFTEGYAHTCALKLDGSVWCWGSSMWAQLNGTADRGWPPLKIEFPGDGAESETLELASGSSHICARRKTKDSPGQLWCWGRQDEGATAKVGGPGCVLHLVDTEMPIVSLGAGAAASSTCAVFSNGLSKCWGNNVYGQLGYPGLTDEKFGARPGDDINDLPFHEFWGP